MQVAWFLWTHSCVSFKTARNADDKQWLDRAWGISLQGKVGGDCQLLLLFFEAGCVLVTVFSLADNERFRKTLSTLLPLGG